MEENVKSTKTFYKRNKFKVTLGPQETFKLFISKLKTKNETSELIFSPSLLSIHIPSIYRTVLNPGLVVA